MPPGPEFHPEFMPVITLIFPWAGNLSVMAWFQQLASGLPSIPSDKRL